jgi:DNA-binding MarR family transcriptional regulator
MPQPPIAPVSFGHAVALAQRALTGSLREELARAGASSETWYTLNTIATRGPALSADALRHELAQAPDADPASVDATLARLATDGLVRVGDEVELSAEGAALHAGLSETARGLTARLLAPFDPADVEVAARVLREITARAESVRDA